MGKTFRHYDGKEKRKNFKKKDEKKKKNYDDRDYDYESDYRFRSK